MSGNQISCAHDRTNIIQQIGSLDSDIRQEPFHFIDTGILKVILRNNNNIFETKFIVSSLDLNPRLQTGRGFSRFLFID